MPNMENKTFEGIFYSRFIASWNNATVGRYSDSRLDERAFTKWLMTIKVNGKEIPNDVIREIRELKTSGKFELEEWAKKFVTEG